MRIASSPAVRVTIGLLVAAGLGAVGYRIVCRRNPDSSEALLERADKMSWMNNWIAAAPLYHQAELQFLRQNNLSKALYARVSQVPAQSESSTTIPSQIAVLCHDLTLPEARNPETRLRVLTILGMLEVNYDSGMARQTWAEVESLAIRQHHYLLGNLCLSSASLR